jgi:hypothetical protein
MEKIVSSAKGKMLGKVHVFVATLSVFLFAVTDAFAASVLDLTEVKTAVTDEISGNAAPIGAILGIVLAISIIIGIVMRMRR